MFARTIEHIRNRAKRHGVLLLSVLALSGAVLGAASWWRVHQLKVELAEIRALLNSSGVRLTADGQRLRNQTQITRVSLPIAKHPGAGSDQAPLTIVEFSDYECPFCRKFYTTTFNELKRHYIDAGTVQYVVYDYPVKYHKNAVKAAQASYCAAEQGKYWQMRNALFENSKALDPDRMVIYAKQLALDITKFRECFGSGKYLAGIQEGFAAAESAGITGTPTFIIGHLSGNEITGRKVIGALPFATFDQQVRESLAVAAAR